ncbi:metabolite transport protein [Pseudoxanthomonas spadix BD-a59]|uniref:Metabolite transport protein n=1 Tax=Pseudoxanthomonas spadix (strain BD-a59) TaxID=1045855 RepID=G7UTP9_PSEUP|nr:metabolite transport protein [Pseudoxanthomonas spadix BD-a59]
MEQTLKMAAVPTTAPVNSPARVLLASLMGTTIEFFDFYIYATAAVLVFPKLFFPQGDPVAAQLASLATFAVAFVARPFGSALFGHFGDRIGRKATLVAALLTMGISTVVIGLLPTYGTIGVIAPALLTLCRFGQGIGLGGEWGGAVLLATENAPPGKRGWYGMFPQLGAPLGFLLSAATFLIMGATLSPEQFIGWGWRVPFIASALLVIIGLWVRLSINETPAFQQAIECNVRLRVPFRAVFSQHLGPLVLGTLGALATFVLFYIMTVFALGYGTGILGYSRQQFLLLQMVAMLFFAAGIPLSALYGDRTTARGAMLVASVGILVFGQLFGPLFQAGHVVQVAIFLCIGLFIMGWTYGPVGTLLAEVYPTEVRYTGSSLSFNLASVLGAAPAPYVATWLASNYGVQMVGYYLSAAALVTILALLAVQRHASVK